MPKATTGRPVEIGSNTEPINRGAPTLADIGTTKKTSMRAQQLAGMQLVRQYESILIEFGRVAFEMQPFFPVGDAYAPLLPPAGVK